MKVRLLALPLIAAGVLSAQGPGPRSLTPPTASEVLNRQVDFLTKFYGLNTTQAGTVMTLVSTEQSCLPTSAAMRTARENLVAAIKTGPAGAATITAALTALNTLQGEAGRLPRNGSCRHLGALGTRRDTAQQKLGNGLGPLLGGPGGRGGGPGFRHGPPAKQ